MPAHEKINYVELAAHDLEATKLFFTKSLGWSFVDYGPDYTSFADEGVDGGFFRSNLKSSPQTGGALIVFYSADLESTLQKIEAAGGTIAQQIFMFPGGRRFHFIEPSGNEFAVWSDN